MNYEQIILKRLEEGTLLRGQWADKRDGRDRACLLAAVAPRCGKEGHAAVCPAEVMPPWLAHLTPCIDDEGSLDKWESVVRRFAASSKNWGKLTQRHEYAVRALAIREAVVHARADSPLCQQALALCDAVAAGGEIDRKAFQELRLRVRPALHSEEFLWWALYTNENHTAALTIGTARRAVVQFNNESIRSVKDSSDRLIEGILRVLEGA